MTTIKSLVPVLAISAAAAAQSWQSLATQAMTAPIAMTADQQGLLLCATTGATSEITSMFDVPTGVWVAIDTNNNARDLVAYSSSGTQAFRFGGNANGVPTNVLERFDRSVTKWLPVNSSGTVPSPRFLSAMAVIDSVLPAGTQVPVVFGGVDVNGNFLGDTFLGPLVIATVGWTQPVTAATPPARAWHRMARGPNNTVVMFGGTNNVVNFTDTWVFSATPTPSWTQIFSAQSPTDTGPMTYDRVRDVTIMLEQGTHWEFDGIRWRNVSLFGSTTPTFPRSLAFDPGIEVVFAAEPNATGAAVQTFRFTPSPAAFDLTLPSTCPTIQAPITVVNRTLPVLGETLITQFDSGLPNALLFMGIEPQPLTPVALPFSCGCTKGLANPITFFLPNTNGVGTFSLIVPFNPAFLNAQISMQGIVLDASLCPTLNVEFTHRGTATIGG